MIDKSQEKISTMFDEIASSYDKLNHLFSANMDKSWRRDIINYIKDNDINSNYVLDIACGTGDLTIELVKLEPVKITAIDISDKMLSLLKSKINIKGLSTVCADAHDLPFEDEYFNLITIGFGIRNFENPEKSFSEIRRVLKKDGILVILEIFKSRGFINKIFNVYFGKLVSFIGNKISDSSAYSYLFKSVDAFFSIDEFLEVCKKNGFKAEHCRNNFFKIVNTVYLKKD
ncbi:MAG: Demethylmenaquinone methyltransferase [Ignavibacteria bacterium]|nr:Demethylmenaquinone methyltransferase [Ignavibacteria bacterium]